MKLNKGMQSTLVMLRMFADLFAIVVAWVMAYFIRFYTFIPVQKGVPEWQMYLKLIPFICVISLIVFVAAGLYKRQHRSAFIEGLDIIPTSLLSTLAIVAFSYFYNEYRYSRVTLVVFMFLQPILIILGRSLIRKLVRYYRKRSPARNVLVIGCGESLERSIEIALTERQDFKNNHLSGVMLWGDEHQIFEDLKFCEAKKLSVFQKPDDWIGFLSSHNIESVVIALPNRHYNFIDEHLDKIADQVSDIHLVPDLAKYTKFAAGIDMIRGVPVISIHDSPLAGLAVMQKRMLDICGSLFALMLFGPVMLVVAALVKLTSKGPILYKQVRMGLDGKTFEIFKFRSMPVDAEQKTGAVWATPNDNRPTKIGGFIRKTSLDELPQFLNVLRGDMSLVGPRPERPVFVDKFRRHVPGYMLRHKTKAGITGWAQINGWRGDTSIDKRIECDLYYIQNWSIWLDIKILLLTPIKGFVSKNAY